MTKARCAKGTVSLLRTVPFAGAIIWSGGLLLLDHRALLKLLLESLITVGLRFCRLPRRISFCKVSTRQQGTIAFSI